MKLNYPKKAISPVITTVLLVLLVIVLASIIMIWWKSFLGETITKLDESSGKQRSIEQFCSRVVLSATLSGTDVTVVNTGSIPVYKVGFQKITKTDTKIQIFDYQIIGGASSKPIPLGPEMTPGAGDKLYIIPILLGNNDQGEQKEFQCPEENWKQIVF